MTPPRRAAGAGLFPGDAAGTLSCFVGASSAPRLLSPVWGLATAACPALLHNLATCAAPTVVTQRIGAAHLLTKELFVFNGFASRPSNSQSKAARHLSPKLLGQLSAMALRHAATSEVEAALVANGVASNKVKDVWTGVSMARYLKLYDLVVAAAFPSVSLMPQCQVDAPPGWAVWQRYVWERMASRSDLLLYFDGAVAGLGADRNNGVAFDRDAFASSVGCSPIDDPAEFGAVVEKAIAADDCKQLERLLCELGRTTCAHCAIKIRKFAPSCAPEGTPAKSDCVELCIRELFGFWHQCNVSVPVPEGTAAHALLQTEWDTAKADPAKRWYDALQGLAGCEYLSECTGNGGLLRYELAPSVANMGAAVATLLGLDAQQVAAANSAEGCVALLRSFGFDCHSTAQIFRAPGTEESRLKEILTVRAAAQNNASRFIEVSFELPHPTAKVAHRLSGQSHNWKIVAAAIKKQQHKQEVFAAAPLWLLRAAVDPDGPLDNEEWRQKSGRDAVDAAALAVMTSRRKLGCDEWRPTEAATFYSEDTTIRELRLAEKRSAKALKVLRSVVEPADASASELIPWLAADVPEHPPSLLQRLRVAMMLR